MEKKEKTTNPVHDDIRVSSQQQYMQTPDSHTHAITLAHIKRQKKLQLEVKFPNIFCVLSAEGKKMKVDMESFRLQVLVLGDTKRTHPC